MKTVLFILLSAFLLLPGTAQNTLLNPSFEISDGQGGVSSWQKRPTTWQDSTVFHVGNHAYRIDPGNNQYTFYRIESDSIDVGREYTLSAWTKTKDQAIGSRVYWRYVNFSGGGLQFPPFDMNNITDSSWTYYEWDFYPTSDDARLDIYWAASQGRFWIDDVSMQLKERSVVSIYSLPEPWRLNIGDQDTCNILVELRDSSNLRVSNGQSQITFVNLDPNILTLVSPTVVNSVFGKAECQCIGTAIAGIGRIEIQSGNLRDTLWISNREKHMPDDFFHIGTWLFASTNSADNQDLIEDLDSLGMNVVFPINGGTAATLSFLNAIQS